MFSIYEPQFIYFLTLFGANFDNVMPFDLPVLPTNDNSSNNIMNSQNESVLTESSDCLCRDNKLNETKGHDLSGRVEKLKVEKNNNPLYLNDVSDEISETNVDPKLERSDNIQNIKLEAKSLNIKSLTGLTLSQEDLLQMVKDNLIKYEAEALKFSKTINNIENGQELFYDPNAKFLLLVYTKQLIPCLIANNTSYLYNMLSDILSNLPYIPKETQSHIEAFLAAQNVPLPEQTKEEIDSLSPSPENVPLPEQTKEEIESLV